MATKTRIAKKSIEQPDEVREVPLGHVDIVTVGEVQFVRTTFEPGWRWFDSVRPIAGTESCEFPHRIFIARGSMHVRMDDGSELDLIPGDFSVIDPGHDAWVTSSEPCVAYDFGKEGADYAKPQR
ncbi:MAG: cupin domain-containing protein [Microthrixaceae bacterium]|nr:cupin domain-containing protein [Microthrixaceae bacterium]